MGLIGKTGNNVNSNQPHCTNQPSVSIVIPVYNVEQYIEDCIRSVIRQTYDGHMECFVVDDCGTDNTIPIVEKMVATYEGPIEFHILHHEHNRGVSVARNTGTMAATGEYLFYLDSDDEITEDCIERLMEKMMERPDIDMVQGNNLRYHISSGSYEPVKEVSLPFASTNEEVRKSFFLLKQMRANIWNKLLRRDFIIKNNLLCREGVIWEDALWTFYLLKVLNKACYVSEATYCYNIRPGSIARGTDITTKANNYGILFYEILTNLTSGYEREEFNCYAKIICKHYLKYVHESSIFKETFQLYREKCKLYGSWDVRILLSVSNVLHHYRLGWMVFAMMMRIRHPKLLFT